ncbi:hypothetical protein D3C75_579140 [compost metagenome]
MAVVKRIDLSLDLTRPAEEIIESIIQVLSYYPGAQLEILQKVDQGIGDMLAALQSKTDPQNEVPEQGTDK